MCLHIEGDLAYEGQVQLKLQLASQVWGVVGWGGVYSILTL